MEHADGRREAGARTRARLIEATKDVLAETGRAGLSLRAVSYAANTNVASIKYHFGSREALINEVFADLVNQVMSRQIAALDALPGTARATDLRAWIEAWANPLIDVVVSDQPDQQRLGRIVGRALSDPAGIAVDLGSLAHDPDGRLVHALTSLLAPVDEAEAWLRVTVMDSALSALAGRAFDARLERSANTIPLRDRLLDLLEALARVPARTKPNG